MSFSALLRPKPNADVARGGYLRKKDEHAAVDIDVVSLAPDTSLKLRPKQTLRVLVQLKAMLEAGVPLLAALRTLIEHAETEESRRALRKVANTVEQGHDLSEAVAQLPRCFDNFIVHLLAAGEKAGALDESLSRSAELVDRQIRLGGKIKSALAYPGFLLGMTVVMTTGILVFLVPKFESLLMAKPELLPWTTKLVLTVSSILRETPWIAGSTAIFAGAIGLAAARSHKIRRAAFDLLGFLPAVGDLIHKAYLARSVKTLALTLESGVPILAGLKHAGQVAQLPHLQGYWESAAAAVADGQPMHSALSKADLPPALIQMMVAGESSGSLDSSLRKAADFLDRETQSALEVFTALLGPATVVIAGSVVGFIVVSLMTPILQMAKFVG